MKLPKTNVKWLHQKINGKPNFKSDFSKSLSMFEI